MFFHNDYIFMFVYLSLFQMKSGIEVDSTEIALAFPLRGKNLSVQVRS